MNTVLFERELDTTFQLDITTSIFLEEESHQGRVLELSLYKQLDGHWVSSIINV